MVGAAVPFIGDVVALVGDVVALVGGPLSGIGGVLRPIQGRGPSGKPGLGCPQRLLGRLSAGLGGPDPGVVGGHSSDPLTLGVLDDLLGQVGQLTSGTTEPAPATAGTPYQG